MTRETDLTRYAPIRCACCTACIYDRQTGKCMYLGPYRGYRDLETGKLLRHEEPAK